MFKLVAFYTFSIMLLFSTVTGCQEQQKSNVEIRYTYYNGGVIESESEFVNGVRHGYRKFFTPEGKLSSVSNYVDGKREGEMKTYYPSGTLHMTANFINGKMDGEALEFYPDGKLKSKKIFRNSVMTYNIQYTPEGKIEFEDKF
jgi:antitoxin component YwqK of YwqJK toxin-antitoxin module